MSHIFNVLEVIRQGKIGGGESHVIDLVRFLDRKVFNPLVLSFTEGPMIEELDKLGVRTIVIPSTRAFDIRVWQKVTKIIHKNNIDLVHAHGSRAQSNVFWTAGKQKTPLIYTVHGWSFHDDQKPWVQRIRAISEKFMVNRADMVINVSKSNQETGHEKLGNYRHKVINNGIDLEKFSTKLVDQKGLKQELKIPNGKIVVGCVMRMTKQKNPLGMLKAYARARSEEENIHLLMVGDGELMPDIVQYINDQDLRSFVTMAGSRKDIPKLLSIMDIYCLPSLWEGLPLSLLEAMAMNKAIIATTVDGTKELIRDGVNGLLVEPNDLDQLSTKIITLSRNKELLETFGQKAKKVIIKNHDVIDMVKSVEDTYHSVLNK